MKAFTARKALTILLGAAALGVVGAGALALRGPLLEEWWLRRAARECAGIVGTGLELESPERTMERLPVLSALVARGPAAYPVLSRLLACPDETTAAGARHAIRLAADSGSLAADPFLAHVARERPAILFDFGFRMYYCCGADDAGTLEGHVPGCADDALLAAYAGPLASGIRPAAEAIELAKRRLREAALRAPPRVDSDDPGTRWLGDFETVDLAALMASWTEPTARGDDRPRAAEDARELRVDRPAAAALDLLRETGRDPDTYPELRLHALNRLEYVRSGGVAACLPQIWHWELISKLPAYAPGPRAGPPRSAYLASSALRPLLMLDHPRTVRVLARLLRVRGFRERIEEADSELRAEGSEGPSWWPVHERADRWLEGSRAERSIAADALAELDPDDARPILETALAREPDPEVRLRIEASLVSLGRGAGPEPAGREARWREDVRGAFAERIAAWKRGHAPIGEGRLRGEDRGPIRRPGTLTMESLGLEEGNRVVDRAADDELALHPLALGLALCRSGLREDLDLVVGEVLRSAWVPVVTVELGRAIEGLPPLGRSDRAIVGFPVKVEDVRGLLEAWDANKERLRWDGYTRRWRGWASPEAGGTRGEPGAAAPAEQGPAG